MCNKLHTNSERISASGTGWKIFRIRDNNILYPLTTTPSLYARPYSPTKKEIVWRSIEGHEKEEKDFGFCFFLDEETALEVMKGWQKLVKEETHVCLKINYKEGLGKHEENTILCNCKSYLIALCKSFSLCNEEDKKKYNFERNI